MRLISCHIENYGKISDADFKFSDTLTVFCEKNGYGKTTLASFIKAMFYGMDSDRTNSDFNERRHFYPFSGGNFGGNLTFEVGGKEYKIERYFDIKSETKDTLTIYCNGRVLPDNGQTPGQKFFGIDRESFERTAFISGADVKILSTGNINKKLNNFVEGCADDFNYEAAKSRLESKSKEYKKTRGDGGLIYTQTQKLNSIRAQISDKQAIAVNLKSKYDEYDKKKREISALNISIADAQSKNVVLANWEIYDKFVSEIGCKREQLRKIEEDYPLGMPSKEEIEAVMAAMEKNKTFSVRLSQKSFTDEDEAKYSVFYKKFADGIPANGEIEEIRSAIEAETKFCFEIDALSSSTLTDKEKAIVHKFDYCKPNENDIEKIKNSADTYKAVESQYNSIPDFIATEAYDGEKQLKNSKKAFLIFAIVSVLMIVAGVSSVFLNMLAGIVTLTIGVVALLITGFVYLNKKAGMRAIGTYVAQSENPEKKKAKDRLSDVYAEIQTYLIKYGYSFENGVQYAVAMFLADFKSYGELKARIVNDKSKIDAINLKRSDLRVKIENFFAKYDIYADNYGARLTKLMAEIDIYKDLEARKVSWCNKEKELQSNILESLAFIRAFCQKYNVGFDQIDEEIKVIDKELNDYSRLQKEISYEEIKAENFKSEKNLSSRPDDTSMLDMTKLNENLSELQEETARIYKEIAEDENDVEKIEELQNEYEETNALLAKYKDNNKLISLVLECLNQADMALKDKYIKPVRDKFLNYSASLEKALGEKIVMNANFEIRYESEGKEHSDEHLSLGQRSLCALCFRLALIDNMYSDEKPFVILDDPFVNLDDEHLKMAKVLLKEVAKKMQIVYFSCHSSRAM